MKKTRRKLEFTEIPTKVGTIRELKGTWIVDKDANLIRTDIQIKTYWDDEHEEAVDKAGPRERDQAEGNVDEGGGS
jgi:hypothetical protein